METVEKKDEKLQVKNQEVESSQYGSNEDHNQSSEDRAGKKSKSGITPPEDAPVTSLPQQHPPVVQWPYVPQPTLEKPLNKHSLNAQQFSPAITSQKQAPLLNPQQQQSGISHSHQLGFSQLTPTVPPSWVPPRPGHNAAGSHHQPFGPIGITDSCWQGSVMVGGTSSASESVSYQGGYPYPVGLPGPWYPPALWGQVQQSQPPYTFSSPACTGGYGYFSVPPTIYDTSTSMRPQQNGIIHPPAKLSQKHKQMWEAQSAENVHLRTAICRLEAEMAADRSRLMKLEAKVSSLKAKRDSTVDVPAGSGAVVAVQTSKRGRPKRSIASINMFPFPDDLQPKSSGREPIHRVESQYKIVSSEKESPNKEDDRQQERQPVLGIVSTSIQEEGDAKIPNTCVNSCGSEPSSTQLKVFPDIQTLSGFQYRMQQNHPLIQTSEIDPGATLEMKSSDKEQACKATFAVPCPYMKSDTRGSFTSYPATTDGNHGWRHNILTKDPGRNLLDERSHAFYDKSGTVKQERKVISGWSFVNQGALEEQEDAALSGKAKDMEEDASSAADEMSPKDEGPFVEASSPIDLKDSLSVHNGGLPGIL